MKLKHVVKQMIAASAVLLLLGAAPHAQAATFTVDRTDDAAISACSAAPNDCSLRGAVTKANATASADTINFDATVFAAPGPHVILLATNLPFLISNVTITGPGASLLRVQATFFSVTNGVSATLSGLGFVNSGISNDGGTVTATDCTLSGNSGIGINNNQGRVTITNCTVSGDGMGNSKGIYNFYGTVTATNCTLNGSFNYGNSDIGIVNQAGTVTASNCTLNGNSKGIDNNGGTVTAINSTLSGNDYAINNSGNAYAINCALSGNSKGIYHSGYGTASITNCTLSGNITGILIGYGMDNQTGTVTATNSTLSDNTDGIVSYGGKVTVTNCTLSGNDYANPRTGISNYGGTLTLNNTLVAGHRTNVDGPFTDGGHNITTGSAAAAGLDPAGLKDNGGLTKTIALLPGSPAIDAGNSTLTADQRGFSRPSGNAPDIGAFELGGLPTLSVNNPLSIAEGSASAPGSIVFDITLNAASTQTVTVKYHTRDGINNPATAGVDYQSVGGTLTFAPGVTLKRVRVPFIGDDKAETKETFFLDLLTPTNATIADSRGVGTIANDDATPNVFEDEPSQ